jgi:hypothetical protein
VGQNTAQTLNCEARSESEREKRLLGSKEHKVEAEAKVYDV